MKSAYCSHGHEGGHAIISPDTGDEAPDTVFDLTLGVLMRDPTQLRRLIESTICPLCKEEVFDTGEAGEDLLEPDGTQRIELGGSWFTVHTDCYFRALGEVFEREGAGA